MNSLVALDCFSEQGGLTFNNCDIYKAHLEIASSNRI